MKRIFVKFLSEIKEPKITELGGKGYSLAILVNNGLNVPKGFVVTSAAFFEFLERDNLMGKIERLAFEINENNFKEKSQEIKSLILAGKITNNITSEIRDSLNTLSVRYVSIRSSAVSEDSLKSSFAGMHDTFLNIETEPDLVLDNVKKCWASLFNERAVSYRIRKGVPHLEGMAVVTQEMIPADVAGTAFTAHPDTGDKGVIIIEATWGIGETLVSGLITPDLFIINKRNFDIIRKTIGTKKIMAKSSSHGIERVRVPNEKSHTFCLSDNVVENLAKISLKIEKIYKCPQDIEWCIYNGEIWVLQSRSITSL
jgi:pyruvate,water dikinase